MTELIVVVGNDHYMNAVDQWVVGLFTTEEEAQRAIEEDRAEYRSRVADMPKHVAHWAPIELPQYQLVRTVPGQRIPMPDQVGRPPFDFEDETTE